MLSLQDLLPHFGQFTTNYYELAIPYIFHQFAYAKSVAFVEFFLLLFNFMKQKKSFDFQVKTSQDGGIFSGYASVFNILDHQGDLIESGAFNTIRKKQT